MKTGKANQIAYYSNRAAEYDRVYQKPERQHRLREMEAYLVDIVKDKSVKEIGCGTAYWTVIMNSVAKEILATDINEAMLSIAKSKPYKKENVSFALENYKALDISKLLQNFLIF